MPIITFSNKEAIPTDLHDGVTETEDGKFEVNLSLTSKVTEFRDNNLTLSEERDKLKTENSTYASIVGEDTAEFTTLLESLRATQQSVDDGTLTVDKDIETEIKARVSSMKVGYEEQLKENAGVIVELKNSVGNLNNTINGNIIGNAVQVVVNAADSGIHASAISDLTTRAMKRFAVESGKLIARQGDAIIYGTDGATPQTITEWTETLKKSDPHLFIQSGGGGGGEGNKKFGGLQGDEYKNLNAREKLNLSNKQTT